MTQHFVCVHGASLFCRLLFEFYISLDMIVHEKVFSFSENLKRWDFKLERLLSFSVKYQLHI